MNLQDLIFEVGELSAVSPRIQSDIKGYINRAQKAICARRNWTFMQGVRSYTILAGATSVNLDSTFKSLTAETSPVTWSDPISTAQIPVKVLSREEAQRYNWALYAPYQPPVAPVATPPTPWVFIDRVGAQWTLNNSVINTTSTQSMTYNISALFYPADLVLGTDSNALTNDGELAEALVNLAKAIAYFAEKPGHPDGMAAMALYESHYRQACYSDARAKIGGMAAHW